MHLHSSHGSSTYYPCSLWSTDSKRTVYFCGGGIRDREESTKKS